MRTLFSKSTRRGHLLFFFFKSYAHPRDLPSSPTRRSSDLIPVNGVSMTTSDAQGRFKLKNDSFAKPSDCKVAVNDGSASAATPTLSGCTVSTSPSPSPTPSPSPAPASTAALSKVTVSPTDVVGGDPSTGTVTLTGAAPSGGFTVSLRSDNTTAATVPASVTVPAGAASARFPITTNVVPNPQSALIIGTDGTVTTYGIVAAWTPFLFSNGGVGIDAVGRHCPVGPDDER